jgi:anaerobic glycerol-3-phosphate dehydrogenase
MRSTEVLPIEVIIIGGSIGGFTAALALLQRGILSQRGNSPSK